MNLQRKLGFSAVLAVVMGDMIGSGIFFTPGELAAVATAQWQVYFFWGVCGAITLCGALTLAELAVLIPRAGVAYHALTEAFGPFAGFMQAWIMVLVSGPGAIAGIAFLFGEFASEASGAAGTQLWWATGGIVAFAVINLRGVAWGGGAQVVVTAVKVAGLSALIAGGLFLAEPVPAPPHSSVAPGSGSDLFDFLQFVGIGVSIVLFTYDGWIDASNVAGEVRNPNRNFPLAMGLGVICITLLYVAINYAYLSVVSLEGMRASPARVATTVAESAFGPSGGVLLTGLIGISIFGALGGLILTLPRLYYAAASDYVRLADGTALAHPFRALAFLSSRSVPAGAIVVACGVSLAALLFFGSFARIVAFFLVPFQAINILMVASIFRLRPRLWKKGIWRMPFYPVLPLFFISVMFLFLVAAVIFNPLDSMIGVALTLAGIPVYRVLDGRRGVVNT